MRRSTDSTGGDRVATGPALQRALVARDRTRLQAVLDRERATDLLLAVTAPDGRVPARAGRTEPSFLPGVAAPGPRLLPLADRPGPVKGRAARVE